MSTDPQPCIVDLNMDWKKVQTDCPWLNNVVSTCTLISTKIFQDLIICDVNADGSTELVVSLTDRVVRNYRWAPHHRRRPSAAASISSLAAGSAPEVGHEKGSSAGGGGGGRLVCVNKWEFASQIGTITCNTGTRYSIAAKIAKKSI